MSPRFHRSCFLVLLGQLLLLNLTPTLTLTLTITLTLTLTLTKVLSALILTGGCALNVKANTVLANRTQLQASCAAHDHPRPRFEWIQRVTS